mmetsp:Transcript_6590/g.27258  ORF Transcript_6590/g.27258 Transcript_6590/m.27258 type:complete len:266 (-) Transcript_6590:8741-9538(-)
MRSGAPSSPDSMMTLSVSGRLAKRTSDRNSLTSLTWPANSARQGSTTSTSLPPAWAMAATSASARGRSSAPSGKLATAATLIVVASAARAWPTKRGQTQTAATGPWALCARRHSASMSAAVSASFRLVRSRQASAVRAAPFRSVVTTPRPSGWRPRRPGSRPRARPRPGPASASGRASAPRPTGRRPYWSSAQGPSPSGRHGGPGWSPARCSCRPRRRPRRRTSGSRPPSRTAGPGPSSTRLRRASGSRAWPAPAHGGAGRRRRR